jgi:hypothetical protein
MFAALAEPFQAIEAVDMELGSPSSRRVTVSTVPSLAATWLVPAAGDVRAALSRH